MKNLIKICLLLVLICLLSNCNTNDKTNTSLDQNSDKLRIGSQKDELSIKFLGKIDDNALDKSDFFYWLSDFTVDDNDNVYVVDKGNYRVLLFNRDLKLIKSIGRQGQGPEEFIEPANIALDQLGRFYVSDNSLLKILVFSNKGKEIDRIPITPKMYGNFLIIDKDRYLWSDNTGTSLFYITDKSGKNIKTVGTHTDFNDISVNARLNHFFYCTDNDNNLYVTYKYQNLIRNYSSSGELILNISRELNYSDEPIINERKAQNRIYKDITVNQVSRSIAIDSNERIWVCTLNRQMKPEEYVSTSKSYGGPDAMLKSIEIRGDTEITETDMYVLEIFDKNGKILSKIPIDHFCDEMIIKNNRLYISDALRAMCIYVYEIIE
ncbi:BF3164 family lipoprotein [candidate division KSB1 bacterium]